MSQADRAHFEAVVREDAASPLFIPLARAYLEAGEAQRAAEVCERGVAAHPNSVVGRALWGRALIQMGMASAAVQQFDLALAVEKDNPQTYNLLCDVLLPTGLYRTVLPFLRQAAALQPYDGRIAQCLEETQTALAGGPAPTRDGFPLQSPDAFADNGAPAQLAVLVDEDAPLPALPVEPDIVLKPLESDALPLQFEALQGDAVSRSLLEESVLQPAFSEDVPPPLVPPSLPSQEAPPVPVASGVEGLPADTAEAPLLADIPEPTAENEVLLEEALPATQVPSSEDFSALKYERRLQARLEAVRREKSFLQRHAFKLSLCVIFTVILGGFAASFTYTRKKNRGETFQTVLAKALVAISADTEEQLQRAVQSLDLALSMDEGHGDALAYKAYALALLYAQHGKEEAHRQAAVSIFKAPRLRIAHPDFALLVDTFVAGEGEAPKARQLLLTSQLDSSVVHAEIGRQLLADGHYEGAFNRLKQAIAEGGETKIAQLRALVALGDYYLAFRDWQGARKVLKLAESLSEFHPQRVLGHAQARLELGVEVSQALKSLTRLKKSATMSEALQGRYLLLLGRAQAANGQYEAALKTLRAAQTAHESLAFAVAMARGGVHVAAGHMLQAQKSYEEALKRDAKNVAAATGLGRVLLASGREKQLLKRLTAETGAWQLALLRGIAHWRLQDFKRARSEFEATKVNGKYPVRAAMYLALLDAAQRGRPTQAIPILEKLQRKTRRHKAALQVALARLYLQDKAPKKAKALLEEAATATGDYEANTRLAQLLLDAEEAPSKAIKRLQRAVRHNASYSPARQYLTSALLAEGRMEEALAQVKAWTQGSPHTEAAWRMAAQVYLEAGALKEAARAIAKVPSNSTDLHGLHVRARTYFAKGDRLRGMLTLERANKLNPKDSDTFCEIANAYARQGSYDIALLAYAAALRENAQSHCAAAGPLHVQPQAGGEEALTLLSDLAATAPTVWKQVFYQATLARVQLLRKKLKDATELIQEAVTAAPASPYAWFAMGEVARAQKDFKRARQAYARAVQLDASWVAPRMAYAEALARQEALSKAAAQYRVALRMTDDDGVKRRVKQALGALRRRLGR